MAGPHITSDVCVIGGGPSGSAIAQRLASLGHDVCLVKREAFPQPRLGATLPPGILPLLECLGVRDRVEQAGFLRPQQIVVWWSEDAPAVRAQPGPPGFHVDRGPFDRLLLQHAQGHGVRVLQPARALQPVRLRPGRWSIPFLHNGEPKQMCSRFLVDASGGSNLIGTRRRMVGHPLLAIYARWRIPAGAGIEGRVEAGDQEWFWYAPLDHGKSIVAVFMDPKRLAALPREGVDAVYNRLLQRFRLFPEREQCRIEGGMRVCDASSRFAEELVGPDFIKIGDAAHTLDPLSSQGIQSAIASALQAAIVVNTLSGHPQNAEAALAFYQDRRKETVRRYAMKTALFYSRRAAVCEKAFWRQRADFGDGGGALHFQEDPLEPTCKLELSPRARIERTPVIKGAVVVSALAVSHEALERPIAFLEGTEIVPLLRQIGSSQTAETIVKAWPQHLTLELRWRILQWLWRRRIVVPMPQ